MFLLLLLFANKNLHQGLRRGNHRIGGDAELFVDSRGRGGGAEAISADGPCRRTCTTDRWRPPQRRWSWSCRSGSTPCTRPTAPRRPPCTAWRRHEPSCLPRRAFRQQCTPTPIQYPYPSRRSQPVYRRLHLGRRTHPSRRVSAETWFKVSTFWRLKISAVGPSMRCIAEIHAPATSSGSAGRMTSRFGTTRNPLTVSTGW